MTKSPGLSEMFDDFSDMMQMLGRYSEKETLKERVQAALDEIEQLQAERAIIVRWMLNEFDVGYHECIFGECSHELQPECVAALLESIEAARKEAGE